jgi:hypothetical protein
VRGAPARARWHRGGPSAALALAASVLALSCALARAAGPPVAGGNVPSTLALSLGEPSPFARAGPDLFTATLRAEVTATDVPVRLSLAEGEAETPLRRWRKPVSGARAQIRLHQKAPSARALRNRRKLLWVTLTAGGP